MTIIAPELATPIDLDTIDKYVHDPRYVMEQKLDGHRIMLVSDTTPLFLTRNGNPKNIRDWDDLIKPGIQVIVVNPQRVQATTLPQLLDFLRKNPGKLNYGSAGNGTSHHLAGELFKLQTKTFITHIPYRGAGPALQDLIAGQVDMMFDGLGSSANHIKNGRIKALADAAREAGLQF